jgi:hypothetical protein
MWTAAFWLVVGARGETADASSLAMRRKVRNAMADRKQTALGEYLEKETLT